MVRYAVYSIPQESGFVNFYFCGMMEFRRWLDRRSKHW
jgi:hypothetical protein